MIATQKQQLDDARERTLVALGALYVAQDFSDPYSEVISVAFFGFAARVTDPRTDAGRAIKAFVDAEFASDFSLAAGDEYAAMERAIGAREVER